MQRYNSNKHTQSVRMAASQALTIQAATNRLPINFVDRIFSVVDQAYRATMKMGAEP